MGEICASKEWVPSTVALRFVLDIWWISRDTLVARENGHENTNLLRQSTFDEAVPSGVNYVLTWYSQRP